MIISVIETVDVCLLNKRAEFTMLCSMRACLQCPRLARRFLSSPSRRLDECGSEKDFRPKKALLVRKVTRYEYEKFYLKPELNEAQLRDYVGNLSSLLL